MTIEPLDEARLRAGLVALAAMDDDIATALADIGPPRPRVREPGFATLLQIVTAQQVSTRAAAAIWARLEQRLVTVTPETLLAVSAEELRALGLSKQKALYASGLAAAVHSGRLDLDALERADDDDVLQAVTALKGFGRWSAEIYMLFALGRIDIFPADDLAVRSALVRLKKLSGPIAANEARARAEAWRPWRGCAALFLWHYYGAATLDRT